MTRYELLDRIGVGGMAEIFRGKAVAAGGFEKPVAIKRILPHLSQDRRFVELLIAEAKVLSLLKHRNIVQIFDVGLGDDGKYFLVMEYVDGKDLRAVQTGLEVRRRRMPFDLALHIGAEVCEALEHAHAAKAPDGKPMSLVHRDVSPSNVLLSRAGEIKLTDFGIAKRAEQEQTGHGAVRGKFAYISPEQARNEHLDPRSDVFSVGVLLWELICNRRLFSGLGDLEALRAVREAKVPRPRDIDRELTQDIDQLLMTALSRDAKNRPTAGQFGAKLRSLRYSLEVTVGDPASELARIIETADEVQRQSAQMLAQNLPPRGNMDSGPFGGHDPSEATVIRIRTADDFAMRGDKDGVAVAKAREVIDRFEEEETRQAQLSGDQMRILRGGRRDSADMSADIAAANPPRLPGVGTPAGGNRRTRHTTDDPTTARPPLQTDEIATMAGKLGIGLTPEPYDSSDESTKLVAPVPERVALPRPVTQPPPMPPGVRPAPSPGDFTSPGTVHERAGVVGLPPRQTEMSSIHDPTRPKPLEDPPSITPQPPQLPPPPAAPRSALPAPFGGFPPSPAPISASGPTPFAATAPAPPQQYQQWNPPSTLTPSPQLLPRPVAPDLRPQYPQQPRAPVPHRAPARSLKPWVLIVGALVMAGLAFAITRAFLS